MSTLESKQISRTYKQLLKVSVSGGTNTGVTSTLQNVQSGDGTNTAIKIATSAVQVTGTFGVSGDVSIVGDLQVTDKVCASLFYGDGSNLTNVPTSGDVSVSTLRVTHNASIGGTLSVVGAVGFNSTATIGGATHLQSTLSVAGATSIGGAVNLASTLTVVGTTHITGNVSLMGTIIHAPNAKVCASSYYGEGSNLTGITMSIGGNVSVTNLIVGGTATVSGEAGFLGTVRVSGATSLEAGLVVGGKAEFDDDVCVSGNTQLVGTLKVTGATTVTGNTGFLGTVRVSGATSLEAGLVVGGKAEFDDDVCVSGNTALVGNLHVGGTVTIVGNTTMTGNLAVGGTTSIVGTTHITGNVSLMGTIVHAPNAKVCASSFYGDGANLTNVPSAITGNISVNNATIGGNLYVGGTATIVGNTTITGNLGIGGTLTAVGKAEFDGDVCVSGNTQLVGTLKVTGTTTITGNSGFLGTLRVAGATSIEGAVVIGGTTPTLTIGDAGTEDAKIVFDGNAQDFYIGLDDTADDLVIGLGSTLGTTPAMSIAETLKTTFGAAAVGETDTDTSNTGSVTLDFDAHQNFVLTFTGNVALANPTTESIGQSGVIVIIQDGTGSRTLSTGTQFEWVGGAVGTISTAGGSIDIIPYFVDAADSILLGAPQLAFATPS